MSRSGLRSLGRSGLPARCSSAMFLSRRSRQHLDAARTGHGGVVLLGGEAGIGKTSLVRRFAADNAGTRTLWGFCDPLTTPRPLGPMVDIAGQLGWNVRGVVGGVEPDRRLHSAAGLPRGRARHRRGHRGRALGRRRHVRPRPLPRPARQQPSGSAGAHVPRRRGGGQAPTEDGPRRPQHVAVGAPDHVASPRRRGRAPARRRLRSGRRGAPQADGGKPVLRHRGVGAITARATSRRQSAMPCSHGLPACPLRLVPPSMWWPWRGSGCRQGSCRPCLAPKHCRSMKAWKWGSSRRPVPRCRSGMSSRGKPFSRSFRRPGERPSMGSCSMLCVRRCPAARTWPCSRSTPIGQATTLPCSSWRHSRAAKQLPPVLTGRPPRTSRWRSAVAPCWHRRNVLSCLRSTRASAASSATCAKASRPGWRPSPSGISLGDSRSGRATTIPSS